MRYIALILTLAGILYALSWWLSDFQSTNTSGSGETIVAPIEDAEKIKDMMEARHQ